MIFTVISNISLALPVSHDDLRHFERRGSFMKEVIYHNARRNGKAYGCISAKGGGLPSFN